MGYTTEFQGSLSFNKELEPTMRDYIDRFTAVRHMDRSNEIIKEMDPDWEKHCLNGNLGENGEFYVIPETFPVDWLNPDSYDGKHAKGPDYHANWGQAHDRSVLNYNKPPESQPGLWCDWCINEYGELEWDGGEEFYNYVEWLEYLIDKIFASAGYVLNGKIAWRGENFEDNGLILVDNNKVHAIDLNPQKLIAMFLEEMAK